jgi:hypothetical protein
VIRREDLAQGLAQGLARRYAGKPLVRFPGILGARFGLRETRVMAPLVGVFLSAGGLWMIIDAIV